MLHFSDMSALRRPNSLPSKVNNRVRGRPGDVWTPADFADLGDRTSIDKALQRLAADGDLRRVGRGLYDRPEHNRLTGRATVPDSKAVIDAIARRDQTRMLVDGMTAANDLGLTTAVPGRVEVLTDARLRPIRLGNQEIRFVAAPPSRLFWAGRPGMRVVQALHWLRGTLDDEGARARVVARLRTLLDDPVHGAAVRDDLRAGLYALPIWMQDFLRDLVGVADAAGAREAASR